ncbi:MAG: GNAT family N-acetyltransferase [Pseudomonadota bacterium]
MDIRIDGLDGSEIARLLGEHQALAADDSPPESDHALDIDGLRAPDITVWSAWDDGRIMGCGALRELDPTHAELKSMHTSADYRRRGVAAGLLERILFEARTRGYERVSLETGSSENFAAARAFYTRHGFVQCAPFGDHREDPYSVFMTRPIDPAEDPSPAGDHPTTR